MNARSLNTIGLVLSIIGVVLIFIWGPPQPTFETGVSIGLEEASIIDSKGTTVEQRNNQVASERRRYVIFSRLGLFFIGLGFGCQLLAVRISP